MNPITRRLFDIDVDAEWPLLGEEVRSFIVSLQVMMMDHSDRADTAETQVRVLMQAMHEISRMSHAPGYRRANLGTVARTAMADALSAGKILSPGGGHNLARDQWEKATELPPEPD